MSHVTVITGVAPTPIIINGVGAVQQVIATGTVATKGDKGDPGPNTIAGLLTAGTNVTLTGSGTSGSPYSVSTVAGVGGGGAGDVVGPASATTNALARFDGTTGKLIKNSITATSLVEGGTGATTAPTARTNLGVQAKTFVTVGFADADYICDGAADEVQIQQAITAVATAGGGIVFVKFGVYFLDAGITFPMDARVKLMGVKWSKTGAVSGGTCLHAAASMTTMVTISGSASVTANADLSHDNHFENIRFSGGAGNATNLFKLKNTDLVKFESCYIVSAVNGIVTEYAGVDPLSDASIPGGLMITNCIIANSGRNLDMQYQGQCWINNVWFDSSSGVAVTSHIRLKSCVKVHIINCEINMATAAIEFEDTATAPCHEITIGGCTFTVGVGNKLWSVGTKNHATSGKINIFGCTRDGVGTYDQLWNEEQPQSFIGLDRDRLFARGSLTGAITFNREDGHTHTATLTGAITATVTNGRTKGDTLTLVLTQDATGSRVITWPATVKSAPTLSTAAGSVDTLVFAWDGTNWNAYKTGSGAGGATNLTTTSAPTTTTINSDTGTDAIIPATDATNSGLFLPAEKTKLTGIATGATANDTDANLKARANHTGTQLAATISDFATATAATASVTANTAKVTNATHTGDVTGATALTIANSAVSNAKLADMATKTYKGRTSAATGVAEDVAVATLKTDLVLVKADVGLGNVDNTSDAAKPVSTAQQTALNLKANLASPTFTGTVAGITSTMVGLGNVDNTSNATERAATATLTNKRITNRVQAVASAATVTPSLDSDDAVTITAQAVGLTLANPTGTGTQFQPLKIRIKDNATAQTIAYGTNYRAVGVTLPTTTVISKTLYLAGFWNTTDTKFDVVAVGQEA